MNILGAILVALGLSMDNLAVAVAAGCQGKGALPHGIIIQISVLFALAHFVMFSAGFLGGHELVRWIGAAAGWAACGILVYIGVTMVLASQKTPENPSARPELLTKVKVRFLLAFATSLDALFVGMSFGLAQNQWGITVLCLTGCVFVTSVGGFFMGSFLGRRFGTIMEVLGGLVLVLIAVKLLLERGGIW